jgi:23S rRNA (guanosine2251-2'-O)-methyltransferase
MLVFGKNVVLEILKKDKKIQKAYVYKHFNDEEILSALQNKNIHIDYLEKHQLDNLANGNHQGIIVSIPDFKYGNIDEIRSDNGFIVILRSY